MIIWTTKTIKSIEAEITLMCDQYQEGRMRKWPPTENRVTFVYNENIVSNGYGIF